MQVGLWLDSSVFGLDYAVHCNQWIRTGLLFLCSDRPLFYTSGKYRGESSEFCSSRQD